MPIEYVELVKEGIESDASFKDAQAIAIRLRDFLNRPEIEDEIHSKDVCGAKSTEIQNVILPCTKGLGFEPEKTNLFAKYECKSLRPDYFQREVGILLEVERGKTRMNNMDLLDIWKCHICEQARYLFLIIPKVRRDKKGGSAKQFHLTHSRMTSFFRKENYVNVDAVFLFGYGSHG
jgi:hypothetical protein